MQLQNDVNPSLQFPATKQRDEYIHVLGCCKTPIYLRAIKPMFLCCGWNKHFIALVIEGFELFLWSQLRFQDRFVKCSRGYPSTSAEAFPSPWPWLWPAGSPSHRVLVTPSGVVAGGPPESLPCLGRIISKTQTLLPRENRCIEPGQNVKVTFL